MQDLPIHSLSNVDLASRRAVCSVCGPTKIKIKKHGLCCWTKILEGRKRWRKSPNAKAAAKRWRDKRKSSPEPYRKHVKPVCERCGVKPVHIVLMDGHHKDRNRKNNSPENIESLCMFCHRLVHQGLENLIVPVSSHSTAIQPSGDVKALLDDNEALTKKVAALEDKVQRVARMTDNEKLKAVWRKLDDHVARVRAAHPDEGW